MTAKDQLKILDRKIKENRADYDLYRQNAEISALSSCDLDKYEYLIGKDLQYKPDPIQKAKLEYSSLGQVFNKRLTTNDKSESLLKRLKNIEDKTSNLNTGSINNGDLKKVDFYNINNPRARKLVNSINNTISFISFIFFY